MALNNIAKFGERFRREAAKELQKTKKLAETLKNKIKPPAKEEKIVDDYSKMSYNELKALAKERGISVGRKKKVTLIKELNALK